MRIESIQEKEKTECIRHKVIVKALVFPVVIYGGESWTIKKAERQRIDAFEELMLSISIKIKNR